jgi:hypothetical protein
MKRGLDIFHGFVTQREHDTMVKICDLKLKRLMPNYIDFHTDSVIKGYREAMVKTLNTGLFVIAILAIE